MVEFGGDVWVEVVKASKGAASVVSSDGERRGRKIRSCIIVGGCERGRMMWATRRRCMSAVLASGLAVDVGCVMLGGTLCCVNARCALWASW